VKNAKHTRISIAVLILVLSAIFWVLLLFNLGDLMAVKHSHITENSHTHSSFQMLLAMNPISNLMKGWILMVLAMMLPKLIAPIQYIYERSLKRKRFWSSLLFVLAYTSVWAVAGLVINAVILGLNTIMLKPYIMALAVGVIALIWQFSPIKQRFLNRAHDHQSLAVFGWTASFDALRFGTVHGIWCIGSGWALMLLPMLIPGGHNLAMIAVAFIMVSEHMEQPRLPNWYLSLRLKLLRILITQTRIKLKQVITTR
tara:strand:+ start:3867 stop:4634 length:768 start_codon:yes stop_codon:yes gene_type:complete